MDTGQPHLLDQVTLQCLIGALHATLGLWGSRMDGLDVEGVAGAAVCVNSPR